MTGVGCRVDRARLSASLRGLAEWVHISKVNFQRVMSSALDASAQTGETLLSSLAGGSAHRVVAAGGIQTAMAPGRSTTIISMIQWTRTSRLLIKISLSASRCIPEAVVMAAALSLQVLLGLIDSGLVGRQVLTSGEVFTRREDGSSRNTDPESYILPSIL